MSVDVKEIAGLINEVQRLRGALIRIARLGRDMSGESCAETASAALHTEPTSNAIIALSRHLDPQAWAEAEAGRHSRSNNIRLSQANDTARHLLATEPTA